VEVMGCWRVGGCGAWGVLLLLSSLLMLLLLFILDEDAVL